MSYYLGRSDFSSYRSGYDSGRYSTYGKSSYSSDSWKSSYSRPSYDSSSWRNSSSSYSSSSYKPKTYDIGSSSLSSLYSSRYGDSSWRTRDSSSKDYSSTEDSKDYLSNGNSTEEYLSKDEAIEEPGKGGKNASIKDFSEDKSSKDDLSKDSKARESFVKDSSAHNNDNNSDHSGKDYSSKTKDPLVKDFTTSDSSGTEYSSRYKDTSKDKNDYLSEYSSDDKKRDFLSKYLTEDDEKPKDARKMKNGDVNILKDFSQTDGISSYKNDKYGSHGLVDSTKTLTLDDQEDGPSNHTTNKVMEDENTSTPKKGFFNFEDVVKEDTKESALFAARETDFDVADSYNPNTSGRYNGGDYGLPYKPMEKYSNLKNKNNPAVQSNGDPFFADKETKKEFGRSNPKTKGRTSSDSGPVSLHRAGIRRFISVVPEENRYITSMNYLPDRIELRLCGMTPREGKIKKWRSIPDLCNITLKPQPSDDEQIQCEEQSMDYSYDSSNEILNYSLPKHEHTKEMYVTQYTHHFDPEEPRSHIAGWKVDVEPNGIPHQKSRMCVMKHPVVSGPSKRRLPRPKSAPPMVPVRPLSPEGPIRAQRVDVVDRGYYTSPRSSRVSDSVFYNSIEDSTDASSLGYAPSDDTSDSSAFFDPRSPTNQNLNFSKPKLIRLSAEFPGIRNLEKMRRKRQSMGSSTSSRPRSSLGHSPPPRDGEYGFFVALTSGDSPQVQSKHGRSFSQQKGRSYSQH